jgi:hypothetical protein
VVEKLTGVPLGVLLELNTPVAGLTLQLTALMSDVVALSVMLCPTVRPARRGERLTLGGAELELLEVELLEIELEAELADVDVLPIRQAASTVTSTPLARRRRSRAAACAGKPEVGRGCAM